MGLTRIRADQIADIDYKQAVRVITLSNVTLTLGAPAQVDGVNLNQGDRVLVAGQSTATQNGLYQVDAVGTGANGTWVRANDANTVGEIQAGMIVMVTEGVVWADTSWKLITNDPIAIGGSALVFAQNTGDSYSTIIANGTSIFANAVSSAITFSAGNNLGITGNATTDTVTFAVADAPVFTGNVQANYFIGNGSQLTGLAATYANANVVAYAEAGWSGNIIPSANNAYSLGSPTAQWASVYVSASTLYLGAVPVSTANNTLVVGGNAVVTANATGTSVTTGNVSITGNITGSYILGNGSQLTGIQSQVYANANVFSYLGSNSNVVITTTGNITSGNAAITGTTAATSKTTGALTVAGGVGVASDVWAGNSITVDGGAYGNVVATQFASLFASGSGPNPRSIMQVRGADGVAGIGIQGQSGANGQIYANIGIIFTTGATIRDKDFPTGGTTRATIDSTGLSVTGIVSATGNITGGNVLTGGFISATGNITGGNIVSGTGSGGSITGANIIAGNTFTAVTVSATGNITGSFIIGNGSQLTGLPAGYSNSNLATLGSNVISTTGTITGGNITGSNILTGGFISATGNITGGNIVSGAGTGGSITGANVISGNTFNAVTVSATGNITGSNLTVGNIINSNANGVGNIGSSSTYFDTVFAKATSAQYADLAEMYCADIKYPPGTVVEFGGIEEVTQTTTTHSTAVAGIVSTHPSYLMNSTLDCATAVEVALVGRVPCRVVGTIAKGDRLVSSNTPGVATALAAEEYQPGCIVGKSLEAYNSAEVGTIEVAVGRT